VGGGGVEDVYNFQLLMFSGRALREKRFSYHELVQKRCMSLEKDAILDVSERGRRGTE